MPSEMRHKSPGFSKRFRVLTAAPTSVLVWYFTSRWELVAPFCFSRTRFCCSAVPSAHVPRLRTLGLEISAWSSATKALKPERLVLALRGFLLSHFSARQRTLNHSPAPTPEMYPECEKSGLFFPGNRDTWSTLSWNPCRR